MRFVMFYHSLESDWNHGNAHFLRGVARELVEHGHDVRILEPRDGWSRTNLIADHGEAAIESFRDAYPELRSQQYDNASIDLDRALDGADAVIVHEWNEHDLVARIGRHHLAHRSYVLLFHDTHHRSVTDTPSMSAYDLRHFDGVLAFGDVIRDLYLERGWARRAWTWHEAADTRVFFPRQRAYGSRASDFEGDVVWIGNWGDEERTAELEEFLFEPVRALGLRAAVYGVRYPAAAQERLAKAGIEYRGWVPNYEVPDVFARFKVTVHVPRRPYLQSLPGVPTIRPFEAMACGIPLISARWRETAGLFSPGEDFLVVDDGDEMTRELADLVASPIRRRRVANRALRTIAARHTCAHRMRELLGIIEDVKADRRDAGLQTCAGTAGATA